VRRKFPHELKISRRTALRGMLGGSLVSLALPALDAMLNDHGDALANGHELPRRLLNWMWGNGCRLEHWVPSTSGNSYTLPAELAPLSNVREHFTVLTNFRNYVAGRRGHHDGMAGLWSCYPFFQLDPMGAPYASKFGAKTFDQIVADIIGQDTFHKSLQIGVTKRYEAGQGPTLQTMSHRGPDQPLAMERDAQALYDKLFMSFTDGDDPSAGLRAKALDTVLGDAQRLKKRVGSKDRLRLDAHLESIFQLQKQILAIPPDCDLPPKPDVEGYNPDGSEPLWELHTVMTELVAMAFTCDLCRVVTLMFTGASGGQHYSTLPPSAFPGYPGAKDYSSTDQHQISHVNLPYEQDFIHEATVFNMQNLAFLLEHFAATDEGAYSLLDSCCVMAASDVAEGWVHSEVDTPIIVAGNARGRLKTGVGHYRSPNEEAMHNVSLACAKSVLPFPEDIAELGGSDGTYDGYTDTPCDAIWVG
jgi:hypothetical protein